MIGNPAYPTYQAFLALGIAAVITAALMPLWIRLLKFEGIGHLVKQGTPTMGGVVILIGVVGASLLVARPSFQLILAIGATLATGALGLFDDISSVSHGRSLGLTPRAKMFGLTVIVVVFFTLAVNFCGVRPVVVFPGGFEIDLGALTTTFMVGRTPISIPWLYFIFVFLLLAGMSNAVNLTDGLDGLAGGTSMMAMLVMAAICFLSQDANLAVFCAAAAGGCIGLPCEHLHGRHRLPGAGRWFRRRGDPDQHRDHLARGGGPLHHRGALRHDPGGELQVDRPPRLPDGAHTPSFREARLGRDEGGHPLLDHLRRLRRDRPRPLLPGIVIRACRYRIP